MFEIRLVDDGKIDSDTSMGYTGFGLFSIPTFSRASCLHLSFTPILERHILPINIVQSTKAEDQHA